MLDLKGKLPAFNPLRQRSSTTTVSTDTQGPEPPSYKDIIAASPQITPFPTMKDSHLQPDIGHDAKMSNSSNNLDIDSTAPQTSEGPSSTATAQRAWVHIHRGDRLGFQGFPNFVVQQIHDLLPTAWPKGARSKTLHRTGMTEFFLHEMPFHAIHDAHPPRDLILLILTHLSKRGYTLETSLGCSRLGRALDYDTLFFRLSQPRQRKFCYIVMHGTDTIRLAGWEDVGVLKAFKRAVQTWPLGIQSESFKTDRIMSIKLKGTPWYILDSPQIAYARQLMIAIMDEMDMAGYELVGCIEATMGIGAVDPRTMYFGTKSSIWTTD